APRRRTPRARRPAKRRRSTGRDDRRPAPPPPSRRTSSRYPAPPCRPLPPKSAPARENTKGGGTLPHRPSPRRPLSGRCLRRGRGLRLRLASFGTLLLDQSHRLDDIQRALQLHVLLEVLHRICRRQWPLLRRGLLRRLDDDVGRDALAVDGAT